MTDQLKPRLGLADAVAQLRSELSKARTEGEGKDVRFAAKEIEIELIVSFGWTAEGSASVPKWVPFVDLSAEGGASKENSHKVVLKLEIDSNGDPSSRLISDDLGPAPVSDS